MELAARKKWSAPEFVLVLEKGQPHCQKFGYQVVLNNVKYKKGAISHKKNIAKANAANISLKMLQLETPLNIIKVKKLTRSSIHTKLMDWFVYGHDLF